MIRRRPASSQPTPEINLFAPQYYFNRELSWLQFNSRVLHEAMDDRTPLLEKLKFLAIFSSNLDEFFMVRIAILKEQLEADIKKLSPDGKTAQEQVNIVQEGVRPLIAKQHHYFEQVLKPQLATHGIHLLDYLDLSQEQRLYLHDYFEEQVFPVLTPLAVDPSHPFPYISNLSLSLLVVVRDPETQEENYARVKVPKVLPRFIALPIETQSATLTATPPPGNDDHPDGYSVPAVWAGIPLEQVIAHNLEGLFPGMEIQEYYPFRVTRNSDLDVEEDEADDLMEAIEQELRKRRGAAFPR